MQPKILANYACDTGEGPLWHPEEKRVYWVDIPTGRLFRCDRFGGTHEQVFQADKTLGGFTIQEDGSLLLFMQYGAIGHLRDGKLTMLYESLPGEENFRFNDMGADPAGRVFCGTMLTDGDHTKNPGRLYRLDTDGSIHKVLDGIMISNGLGFTPDHKHLYYTDSLAYTIYRFDYDEASGAIHNQTVFADVPQSEGLPDGMTVDAEGYVWSARWDGYAIVRYAPDGTVERRLHFPNTKKVSSLTFGGPDTTDIFITTAGGQNVAENGADAGALYHLNLGIRGIPEFRSKVKVG